MSGKKTHISLIIDCNLLISIMTLSDYLLLSFNCRRNHWNALIKQLLIWLQITHLVKFSWQSDSMTGRICMSNKINIFQDKFLFDKLYGRLPIIMIIR